MSNVYFTSTTDGLDGCAGLIFRSRKNAETDGLDKTTRAQEMGLNAVYSIVEMSENDLPKAMASSIRD